MMHAIRRALCMGLFALPTAVLAQDVPTLNSGDTAWMLTATALVLLMTIPGLALFYAGMVRSKNVLSVMMQCFAITGLVTVLWVAYGYSVAFSTTGMEKGVINLYSFIGAFDKAFFAGVGRDSLVFAVPETVFATFQLTFAIITPALIVGAFAERMKFSALLLFVAGWFTFAYLPIAHMVWAGDGALMWDWGVLDLPAVPWCTSTPASPDWWLPWCWASARAIRPPRCRRTT
jgi:Amt family ammonium transporter